MKEQQNNRPAKKPANNNKNQQQKKPKDKMNLKAPAVSRGAAIRAQRRNSETAVRMANKFLDASGQKDLVRANHIDDSERLKVTALGGMEDGGSNNMILLEYKNDALVMDCGINLGIDLPGINYGITDITYLEKIKHKLRAYVITHGHLDHMGALPHIVPKAPAPIYGGKFTIGRVEEIFGNFGLPMPEGFELKTVTMNEHTHEKLKIGAFFVELVAITHSIPGSTCIVVDTPVGRVVNTGDFRLDPNPLDHEKTDTDRLIELGKEGVLLLLSESTTTERPGRTPSESTIEPTYVDLLSKAPGRVFIGIFSTNINRIQMIINAAAHDGRKIAIDGRSMVSTLEMAIRHGFVKVPKGTFVPISSINTIADDKVVIVCTGGQGEPMAALVRMSAGEHRNVKMKAQDTVILSSTPIPYSGNDSRIRAMVNDLLEKEVHVYRHETREMDKCGPLHVSGHASAEEYKDMINMLQPKFFVPIYGDFTSKQYHIELAIEEGIPRKDTLNVGNGEVMLFTKDKMELGGVVEHGIVLVDQTGAVVSNVVVKDRIMMSEDGLVTVVLTIDKKTKMAISSPDIISRGFIYMRDNEQLMNDLRVELKRAVAQRYKRVDLDRFKQEIREHVVHFLYDRTQRSPIVIPVVNIVGGGGQGNRGTKGGSSSKKAGQQEGDPQQQAAEQQRRFAQMRAQLVGQDPRTD